MKYGEGSYGDGIAPGVKGMTAQTFHGIPFEERDDVPPGQIFMMSNKPMEFRRYATLTNIKVSRWRRFVNWLKRDW